MRRPVWRRDWAGWSGGWYPDHAPRQLTIHGIYGYDYSLTVMAPLIGDVTVGWLTKRGMDLERRYMHRSRWPTRHFHFRRHPIKEKP